LEDDLFPSSMLNADKSLYGLLPIKAKAVDIATKLK
jgi:hypothetical protein